MVSMMNYNYIQSEWGQQISIVVLTNHSLGIVNRLIDRLLPQISPERHELVFLDNNSSDGTVEYLRKIPFPNKKILTVEPGTFSHSGTRMWGADHCTGDIVVFFTDDIIPFTENFLEELLRPVVERLAVAACGACQIDSADGDPLRANRFNGWYMTHPEIVMPMSVRDWEELEPRARRTICNFDNCAACYDRELLLKFHFPALPYGEDMGIAKLLLMSGFRIATAKRARFYHWHNVTFTYYLKRMCIDQIVTIQLFGWAIMQSKSRLILQTVAQVGLYTFLALTELKKERLRWIWYNCKYVVADNLGRYIGGLEKDCISPLNFIDKYLLGIRDRLWSEVACDSIIRNKS